MKKRAIGFGKYSSKVKRVNIPVPSFEYVHKSWFPGRTNKDAPDFMIGRDRIIEKLKTWLVMEKSSGGSYLITGYRGMGKTCFVNRVLYELVGEPNFGTNLIGYILLFLSGISIIYSLEQKSNFTFCWLITLCCFIGLLILYKRFYIKEVIKKYKYLIKTEWKFISRKKNGDAWGNYLKNMKNIWKGFTTKEWDRINNLVYGTDVTKKKYSQICVNVNLGQEILDERSILCVLTSQLYNKYVRYVLSPISNFLIWGSYTIWGTIYYSPQISYKEPLFIVLIILVLCSYHQIHNLRSLHILKKRIDAEMKMAEGAKIQYKQTEFGAKMEYSYPIADIREIESQLIEILDKIRRFPIHPTFYFVFDELDKIERPAQKNEESVPEYSGEKYLSTGGTSRKRKFTVMHLLANMKYFTTTAKAKFIFIAGREMYDAYLADLTDRESAISSLFNGVIYVESFCKNEKSDKDVIYNTETFIARQLLPKEFIADKVMDRFIECKLKGTTYTNIDINLKLYFEYLTLVYTDNIFSSNLNKKEQIRLFNAARFCIDKTIGLLYHFTVYLYHLSNGSPKKIRLNFESRLRPLRNKKEFLLTNTRIKESPLEQMDLDIYIPQKSNYLLSLGEREQRVIGFIHYISFPVNQIITDANQFGDKLLISASYLINHLYKYHSGGFSWRNIEQTPELLEVYRIPEFRGFINSILTYLLQTHIIRIPCGLYQFKFRKQISEEISLASKVSEEISAIFNFTLDESQAVKRHYIDIQKKYIQSYKKDDDYLSPHTAAGLHHILGDLYMADEEYNQAIFEYQIALKDLEEIKTDNADSHHAALTLAYIRNMLKLGAAFEKRKTYTSAYNTYNEIIDRLIQFREFDETQFELNHAIKYTENWPYYDTLLYKDTTNENNKYNKDKLIQRIIPQQLSDESDLKNLTYKTKGNHMISDLSHHMTPSKHTVIQRLAMLEDTQLVYQALLAKLFINEKIELGGITRSNLDVIEGEYKYIHLTTNEKEKFLISTDFFRRLGDIMFYKNGLIGFNYTLSQSDGELHETFVDSLYYWAFNIETELQDYCSQNNCYELFPKMLKDAKEKNYEQFKNMTSCFSEKQDISRCIKSFSQQQLILGLEKKDSLQVHIASFWEQRKERLKKLPLENIETCNNIREAMWKRKRTMPCFACKYYNRSLRIIILNLFGAEAESNMSFDNKNESKTIRILRLIVKDGSAKSVRQNHMIQLAEVLDCLGNTTLSCFDTNRKEITAQFLSMFLHDVHKMNTKMDEKLNIKDFHLLTTDIKLSKLETCILYYWEAYICFRYGREQKKAFGSLKKILRVIQNYLRVVEESEDQEKRIKNKACIGEFINEIKNRIIKQCLICLYSHYNFINLVEIQQLKWIFYTQMYENISLNRLTLFPDVEEVMLIYYEIIALCLIDEKELNSITLANQELENVRKRIYVYATSRDSIESINYSWDNIQERNIDFESRLIGIYNNISMGTLRHENTIYERILSLRMKIILNKYILFKAFPELKDLWENPTSVNNSHAMVFIKYLTNKYSIDESNNEWQRFFPNEDFSGINEAHRKTCNYLHLIEFLIRDSIYCLTSILETISPYTTTTLFTHSFIGSIYQSLNKWNILFDVLFWFYKFFDENNTLPTIYDKKNKWKEKFAQYDKEIKNTCNEQCKYKSIDSKTTWGSKCPKYNFTECKKKKNRYQKNKEFLMTELDSNDIYQTKKMYNDIFHCNSQSDRFFESTLSMIGKHNIRNTLTNYSGEMSLKSYRSAKEVHREGKAYKEMISRMHYLDDDLKNDTIQFDLAIERFKINSDNIDNNIKFLLNTLTDSIYDVENFCTDNEVKSTLENRFPDLFWNINESESI